ncbi:MAG: hypothetical protein WC456_04345 [Patescibacteria group bacterium]
MYNKIASIILNSAKAAGLSDVYVAQPDSLKENLAGKIFVLAEIGGKKNEGRKIFDFLVSSLDDNYYNDEKILFRGKIEGLKIENIFEAAIAKTNKNLADFLTGEKLHINPAATNITIGVIYENKLHFANFGRNRALLIYRHGENYEMINVEANAAEAPESGEEAEAGTAKATKLFSSVISGEVPFGSYFVFASEALPEYLSGKEMISILTKLPPITAAEQIKNVLLKMNTYVPFLGIIIKNTAGLSGLETREELAESLSARPAASSLNYTEEKTEEMLAPAGLISFSKIWRQLKEWGGKLTRPIKAERKRYLRPEEKDNKENKTQPPLDLGQIKSLNLARADSFLIKEKIFFKKKPGWLGAAGKRLAQQALNIFSPEAWSGLVRYWRAWLKDLNPRNRWLFSALGLVVLIFIGSLVYTNWQHGRQAIRAEFTSLVSAIEEKENDIDAHLLYNDEAGAGRILAEAQALIASLPQKTKEQKETYQRLDEKLAVMSAKIQKIVKVPASQVNDLSGLGAVNLVYAAGKIYAAGGASVYELAPGQASSTKISVNGATDLKNPIFDGTAIYYQDANRVVRFNIKTKAVSPVNITGLDQSQVSDFDVFSGNLYVLAKTQNQIHKYNKFTTKSDWLKETVDLSQAAALGIDGSIYVLNVDGSVMKFYLNKKTDYAAGALSPAMASANKLIVGDDYLYVFEAASKRLAVLAKQDGHLINQYVVDSLDKPKDVAVDEEGKAAYFLSGEAVYKVSLNQ